MILFAAVKEFFEYCAEQSSFIQHTTGAEDHLNRFSSYTSETVIGQNSSLGFPRLEIISLPQGNLTEYYSSQDDNLTIRVRVLQSLDDRNDFEAEMTAQDNCKKALMQIVSYIKSQQDAGNPSPLLCAFNIATVKYQYIDKQAVGGSASGCEMSVTFKRCVDWEAAEWGELPPFNNITEGSLAVFLNGNWTSLPPGSNNQVLSIVDGLPEWSTSIANTGVGKPIFFTATAGQYTYTVADVPRLADAVGNIILRVMVDASYIMDANVSWDDTSFAISNITLDGTEKIIIEHQTPD